MRKKSLKEVPWEGILAEHLFERVPKKVLAVKCPELAPFEKVAKEYMASFPASVPDAIESASAEWGDRAVIDNVLERLIPPFVQWAREVKGLELNDNKGSLY